MKIVCLGYLVNLYFFNDLCGWFWEDGVNLELICVKKSFYDLLILFVSYI